MMNVPVVAERYRAVREVKAGVETGN